MPAETLWMRFAFALTALTLVVSVLFASLPALDLWVSALFWSPAQGFRLASAPGWQIVRQAIRTSGDVAAVVALLIAVANRWLGPVQQTGWRVWAFVTGTVLLSPVLLVNQVLKAHVGRARPAHLTEFGGTAQFSPPFELAGQCAANCSFTSGEAAMVAAMALPVAVVLWRNFGPAGRAQVAVLAAGYIVLGSGLRVAMGRHFLSDVLFSVLFTALITLGLYRVLDIGTARRRFHIGEVPGDLWRIGQALTGVSRKAAARMRLPHRPAEPAGSGTVSSDPVAPPAPGPEESTDGLDR